MARPRKNQPPTRAVNLDVDQELDRQFEDEIRSRGIRLRREGYEESLAVWVSMRPLVERFVASHPREEFASKIEMADAFMRWLNDRVHLDAPQLRKVGNTGKTSFNFPDEILNKFREISHYAGESQTSLAIEAFRDLIAKKSADISVTNDPPGSVNNSSALKLKIDAMRMICDEMAALLTPGDQTIVEDNRDAAPAQADRDVIIGTVAGAVSTAQANRDRTAELIEQADENYERARSSLAAARRELDDIGRDCSGEEDPRGEEGRTHQKVG